MKIAIFINTAWNIYNYRAGLIRHLIGSGHKVVAIAPSDPHVADLGKLGCTFRNVPMHNMSINPLAEALLCFRIARILRDERPDVLLTYTIKPNVYGSLVARLFRIPVINNVSGLGTSHLRGGWLSWVTRRLYTLAFRRSRFVFFQNGDDKAAFVGAGIVNAMACAVIPGSGIDMEHFRPKRHERQSETFRFLMMCRLLRDKGIEEYVAAARQLKAESVSVVCELLGFVDAQNPTAVSAADIARWEAEGVVRYLGVATDVRDSLELADCMVLPSYREGLSRGLLEASAMEVPVITTNVPGCRDVVIDGVTGLLVEPRDAGDLYRKMKVMASTPLASRQEMGRKGRAFVARTFGEKIVIEQYMEKIRGKQ